MKKFLCILSLLILNICAQEDHVMEGMYGRYAMTREGSGTAWGPDSTSLPGIHFMRNDWIVMMHGFANALYDRQRGPRGDQKFLSENFFMVNAHKRLKKSVFGLRGMISLEPGTIGKKGYPLLLQTGETADGKVPLIDRQHAHDLFMELATVYSHSLSDMNSFFIYFGLPGEPALGPTVFMHRFSAMYNPEAPISHHWLDSTHITFGVVTVGFILHNLKIDASLFTGREPDQHRWNFDRPRFDSYCGRVSYNVLRDISLQVSAGFLKSPEQLKPTIDTTRITSSVIYNTSWLDNNFALTLAWGRNINKGEHTLDAILLEFTYELRQRHIFFGRFEYVAKDELFIQPDPLAGQVFKVGKFDGGYIYEFDLIEKTKWGVGAVGSFPLLPDALKAAYGETKFSFMVFLRVELRA